MKDLKARKYSPVYVLMGEEPFYIDKICDYISENVLQPEERDFNQTVVFGAEIPGCGRAGCHPAHRSTGTV